MTAARSPRQVFWATWGTLMLLASVWAVANPLMASPDEPAHTVKAASVVRGQLLGPAAPGGSAVTVPYFYHRVTAYPVCYMFRPEDTGVCEPAVTQRFDEQVASVTPAGRYNPLYYAVVGLPTLLPPGDAVLYLMRLVSAALCTFLVALGLRAVAETPVPGWAVAGAAAALTPMTIFLFSTVNPAAVEIAAAFALWSQLLTLLRHPDPERTARRVAWVAVSSVVLVNARGLSLLYCAVLVLVVLVVSSWSAFTQVLRRRDVRPWLAVIAAGGAAGAAWVVAAGSLGSGGEVLRPDLTFLSAAKATVLATNGYVTNMVGQFGWMDTNLENWVQMLFAAAVGAVVVLALAVGSRRDRLGLALVGLLSYVLPVVVHASQAQYLGLIWQGRYILPVSLGLPLLAGYVLVSRLGSLPRRFSVSFATVVGGIIAAVQLAALVENVHRYVNGEDGGWFSLAPDAWLPPLPLGLLGALATLAVAAWWALLVWTAHATVPGAPAPGTVVPALVPGGTAAPVSTDVRDLDRRAPA
ncbi:MAG: hypothetical protein JWP95_1736 [Actinotalea sp.]|nr:hypothetical protein [Actinotalea sp.]